MSVKKDLNILTYFTNYLVLHSDRLIALWSIKIKSMQHKREKLIPKIITFTKEAVNYNIKLTYIYIIKLLSHRFQFYPTCTIHTEIAVLRFFSLYTKLKFIFGGVNFCCQFHTRDYEFTVALSSLRNVGEHRHPQF